MLALSTRTWYEERLPIADDLLEGGLPEDSSILPWAVSSIDPTTSTGNSVGWTNA